MAVGLRLKFPGATQQQYDTTHGHLDVESNPPGGDDLSLGGTH
jgi:hypothetical protein